MRDEVTVRIDVDHGHAVEAVRKLAAYVPMSRPPAAAASDSEDDEPPPARTG